jgi:hypothetical protein
MTKKSKKKIKKNFTLCSTRKEKKFLTTPKNDQKNTFFNQNINFKNNKKPKNIYISSSSSSINLKNGTFNNM